MSEILKIILTGFVSAIFTGIFIFTAQKFIEKSFAKKMEEFKSELEFYVFQQQTKFSKSYEKGSNAFENIRNQLVDIRNNFEKYKIMHGDFISKSTAFSTDKSLDEQVEKIDKLIDHFHNSIDKNKIHIPSKITKRLDIILFRITYLRFHLVSDFFLNTNQEYLQWLKEGDTFFKINRHNNEIKSASELHTKAISEIDADIDLLEKIYRELNDTSVL